MKTPKAWFLPGLLVLVMGFVGVVGVSNAFAQSDWDLKNRVKRIENEINTLSRAVYKGETPPPGSFDGGGQAAANNANMEIRLQQIETEMRELRGELEKQSFETRQLREQLERFTSDMELRMNEIEGRGGSSVSGGRTGSLDNGDGRINTLRPGDSRPVYNQNNSGQSAGGGYQWGTNNTANSGASNTAPSGQLGSYTENASGGVSASGDLAAATYENAFALVKSRKYERAQVEFEAFLREHPDHPLAGNAQYWLGETHYVRGNFDTAARLFAEGYKKYPENSKKADNLLKLALSLDAVGKSSDACTALGQLKKENPENAGPVMRRADQEISRLGC